MKCVLFVFGDRRHSFGKEGSSASVSRGSLLAASVMEAPARRRHVGVGQSKEEVLKLYLNSKPAGQALKGKQSSARARVSLPVACVPGF